MAKKNSLVTRFSRIANNAYDKRIPIVPGLIMRVMRIIFSCDIPYHIKVGEGTVFFHNALGVVVHHKAKIGDYNKIMQNVTIGGRNGRSAPKIGDYCFIGTGACILGDVNIGNNVIIGANAVVIDDVPDNAVVVGVPAKVIKSVDSLLINKFKD
ncbi:serine acetyltransferase [Priestia megaterium NCT-2]|uniref:serine O-acetyltransferase n=1 Tax=Priestia megaterium TaxID=1404 RepID=UPI00034DE4ED|nr:serine acetyltransferase [Priestia megaterium]AYE52408.1 serine acetyltransferase [Priestia megaterium NCT-2]